VNPHVEQKMKFVYPLAIGRLIRDNQKVHHKLAEFQVMLQTLTKQRGIFPSRPDYSVRPTPIIFS
jgi:hypothetical protein